MADKAIIKSPAEAVKRKKVVKPIRVTPTFEEFNAMIADGRQQKWNAEAQASADFLEFMGLVLEKLTMYKIGAVRARTEACNCRLGFLPAYGPDCNPIEFAFS